MRRRYVQQPDGELVEVSLDYVQESNGSAGHIFTDSWLEGTTSPIDGSLIDTRAKMRAHMKLHNVAHTDEIAPDAQRARVEQQRNFEVSRKEDLIEAYRKVSAGYKPQVRQE